MRALLPLLAAALLLPAGAARASPPTVVAVLELEDATGRFDAAQVRQWSWYLRAQLMEGEKYRLLPPPASEAALDALLADAHLSSKDEARRPEPGRRASARLLVEPRLIEAEGRCAIIAAIYDVERGVADRVAQRQAPCEATSLARAAKEVGRAIAGEEPLAGEIEAELRDERDAPLCTEWLTMGLGYGSTLGGAAGMALTAQLFGLRGRWWSWNVVDGGLTLGATREGAGIDRGAGHSAMYVGSTAGLALDFGGAHRVELHAGPGLHRSAADDFFGEVPDADTTGGVVPAALLSVGYSMWSRDPVGAANFGVGVALRAVVPTAVERGAPQLVLATVTFAVGE